jgi:hypothetical protein
MAASVYNVISLLECHYLPLRRNPLLEVTYKFAASKATLITLVYLTIISQRLTLGICIIEEDDYVCF